VRCARGAVLLGEITAVLAQPNVCLRNREGGLGSLAVCIVNKRAEFDGSCCALFEYCSLVASHSCIVLVNIQYFR